MLYYERTDIFEGIYNNKKSVSKECGVCYYWYFLDEGFVFQQDVCNRCHGALTGCLQWVSWCINEVYE